MSTTYTIPNRPSGSDVRSISALLADFDAILAGMNSFDGGNIQNGTVLAAALADAAKLGITDGASVRRGKTNIATTEARSNVAYGVMTTPDRVSGLVLPSDGLIVVGFQATWQESVLGAGRGAIFIGANQLKYAISSGAPGVQEASVGGSSANLDLPVFTTGSGLTATAGSGNYTGDVTTGQILGQGFVVIFAAAGTYDVSVQFKASSGSVTVKNRKLWVSTIGF
jgi:hypothetical protein